MPNKKTKTLSTLKRSPQAIQAVMDQVVSFVKKNPGLRIEEINGRLRTSTQDLALPIRKLIAEGRLKTKGQKRATTYAPGRKA